MPGGSKVSPEAYEKSDVLPSQCNPIWNTARSKYTDAEVQRLREYVINRGGFVYIATHGNTDNAMRGTRKVLRNLLPEHHLGFVPNDHPIYNSYYSLNGPLRFPLRKDRNCTEFWVRSSLWGPIRSYKVSQLMDGLLS